MLTLQETYIVAFVGRRVARGKDKPECPPRQVQQFFLPSYNNNVDGI